ncbi:MAG: citrate synthase [Acidimicrobiales bacterium]
MPGPTGGLIDATTASRRLGVKPSTLYAYVSRGRIQRHRREGARGSWYDPAEIDALRRGRGQVTPAGNELAVTTAITRIADDRLWYRGHDVTGLCREAPFEAVCALLWHGTLEARLFAAPPATVELVGRAVELLGPGARLIDRLGVAVGVAASADPLRFDLSAEAVADSGRRLIATLVESLPPRQPTVPTLRLADGVRRRDTVAARLWRGLAPAPIEGGVAALNAVLILLADHELATSTLAARVAASTRANPYAAVSAALGVFDGPLHGTVSEEVFALIADSERIGAPAAIAERLRRGHPIPGFGHRLYRLADPRADVMLDVVQPLARRTRGGTARLATALAVRDAAAGKSATFPNSEFGLGAFTFVTGMPPDAGEAIFATARVAGWVAHALEEYAAAPLRFRSRAVYTGVMP